LTSHDEHFQHQTAALPDLGSQGFEQLQQGFTVCDHDLRLVAWND